MEIVNKEIKDKNLYGLYALDSTYFLNNIYPFSSLNIKLEICLIPHIQIHFRE